MTKKGVKESNSLNVNDYIWYQHQPKSHWEKGKIIEKLSNRTYKMITENNVELIRNKIYLRFRNSNMPVQNNKDTSKFVYYPQNVTNISDTVNNNNENTTQQERVRRPVKKPAKYNDFVM